MSEQKQEQRILGGSWDILPPSDKTPENDSLAISNFRVDQAGVLRVTAPPVPTTVISAGPIASITKPYSPGYGPNALIIWDGHALFLKGSQQFLDFTQFLTVNSEGSPVPYPLNIIATLRSGYMLNPWIAKRFTEQQNGTAFLSEWMPPPPAATMQASSTLGNGFVDPGSYEYFVTFVAYNAPFTGDEQVETNPTGPVSVTVSGGQSTVNLTNIPTWGGSNYLFVHRRLYRAGGILNAAYLAAEIPDNTTTTWNDVIPNEDILKAGTIMQTDNDAPPHARGLIGPFFGRLIAYNSTTYPNRLWWSKVDQSVFPGSESGSFFDPDPSHIVNSDIGQWVDIGPDFQGINAVSQHSRMLVIYTVNSIWRILGDPDTGTLEQASSSIGIPVFNPNLVANAGAYDYFYSLDGIYRFDLDRSTKISQKIEPIFYGVAATSGAALTAIQPIATPICLAYLNGQLLFSYIDTGGNWQAVIYHEETERWAQVATSSGISTVCNIGSSVRYVTGHQNGMIGQTETGIAIDVPVIFQTKYLDQGSPDTPKLYAEVIIDHELRGATLSAELLFDNGAGTSQTFSITGTARTKAAYAVGPDGTSGTNISMLLNGTLPVGAAIHAIYIYYYVDARISVSQVSRPFSLGSATEVYQCKQLEIDALLYGTATLKLSSDVPNVDQEMQIAAPTAQRGVTRRNYNLSVFPADGRIWQLSLDTPAGARLYGGKMLVRKYGVFVEDYEAVNGYVWEHTPTDFGVMEDKVFDQIHLDLDANGVLNPSVLVDQPADVLAVAQSFSLLASSGRRWYTLELALNDVHGKNFLLRIPSTVGYKLYRARVRFRRIGRYFSNAVNDQFRTLEEDFGSERVKLVKKFEIDLTTSGPVNFTVLTDDPNNLNNRATFAIDTLGIRQTVRIDIPGNVRGRIWRLDADAVGWGRLFAARAWLRTTGDNGATPWRWASFAVEQSEPLPTWHDLPVAPTSDVYEWMPIPVPFGGAGK